MRLSAGTPISPRAMNQQRERGSEERAYPSGVRQLQNQPTAAKTSFIAGALLHAPLQDVVSLQRKPEGNNNCAGCDGIADMFWLD